MVKGYEYAKDQYVTFTDEEVKAAAAEATKAIEIKEFVPLAKIEPVFFDRSYYLGPDKGGAKPYRLLKEAMNREGVVGLAQYAVRGKQYLVAVRPTDEGLIMQQLFYADEIRPFSDVPLGDEPEVTEQELALALQIVQMTSTDSFKPEKYEDTVRQALNEMIDQKIEGEEVTISMAEEPRAQVVDLMAALKASLQRSAEPRQVAPSGSGEPSAKESTG
jgi:DNA end-binding protein Ku